MFKQYQRKGLSEMREYVKNEDLTGISVSAEDDPVNDMGMVARNPKNHDDQWYVARKYFEENLLEVKPAGDSPGPYGLLHLGRGSFGEALRALKKGERVCRSGWNGKGMFLFLLPAGRIPKSVIHDGALKEVMEQIEGDHFDALGSIRMFTADKKVLTGWLASQTDMLEEDWMVLE